MNLIITEGIEGCWYYHLSYEEKFIRGLCGSKTMTTSLPLSAWGKVSHLKERYCKECEKLSGVTK